MNRDTFTRLRRAARIAPDADLEIRHNGRLFLFGRRAAPYFVGDTYFETNPRAERARNLTWAGLARKRGDKAFARILINTVKKAHA